jgi:single-strand DNA-binding protein
MNLIIISGFIGKIDEMKTTPTGKNVIEFSVATANGKDNTDWHKCQAWSEKAEFIEKYFSKGSGIEIQGRLTYDNYEKDGIKKTFAKIVVNQVEFAKAKKSESAQAETSKPKPPQFGDNAKDVAPIDFDNEDVPF